MPASPITPRALSDTFNPPLSSAGSMAALGFSEAQPWQRTSNMAKTAEMGGKRCRFGFMVETNSHQPGTQSTPRLFWGVIETDGQQA